MALPEINFNPLTHSQTPNILLKPSDLAIEIIEKSKGIKGITISVGEPFDQAEGLLSLISSVREKTELSVILLSGYTYQLLENKPHFSDIIKHIDVLIAGPYQEKNKTATHLAGSSNKTFHFFTNCYSISYFENIPPAEIYINADGHVLFSGIEKIH